MTASNLNVHIIGAGMAGMTAALRLKEAGVNCKLFEKSRGVGGRLSTRRTREGLQFDHGAQYFTARSPAFVNALGRSPWERHVKTWQPVEQGTPYTDAWFVGAPAMKSPLKFTADQLDIQVGATVERIVKTDAGWQVSGEGVDEAKPADVVIISAPAPQASALTPFSSRLQSELSGIQYDPCWALMAAFSKGALNAASVFKPESGVFSWVAQNSSKPDRDQDMETWVAHATTDWSREHLEVDKADAAAKLLPSLQSLIGNADQTPAYLAAHRWRYARVAKAASKPYLLDETNTVFVIGDGCLGPRVECAFESGMAAANYVLDTLTK